MGEGNGSAAAGAAPHPPPPAAAAVMLPPLAASRGPVFPPSEQLQHLHYCIQSHPSWPHLLKGPDHIPMQRTIGLSTNPFLHFHGCPEPNETAILAFQHYIVMLGTVVMIATILVPRMGGNNGDKARVIQTLLFMSGINTLLQTFIGTRLPTVMNSSFAFLIPVISVTDDFALRPFTTEHERFLHTMRAIQGALIVSSFLNIIIGYSKIWGKYSR
ncbi:hypothetical protein ACLOJK_038716 [Asimina triloba]